MLNSKEFICQNTWHFLRNYRDNNICAESIFDLQFLPSEYTSRKIINSTCMLKSNLILVNLNKIALKFGNITLRIMREIWKSNIIIVKLNKIPLKYRNFFLKITREIWKSNIIIVKLNKIPLKYRKKILKFNKIQLNICTIIKQLKTIIDI